MTWMEEICPFVNKQCNFSRHFEQFIQKIKKKKKNDNPKFKSVFFVCQTLSLVQLQYHTGRLAKTDSINIKYILLVCHYIWPNFCY